MSQSEIVRIELEEAYRETAVAAGVTRVGYVSKQDGAGAKVVFKTPPLANGVTRFFVVGSSLVSLQVAGVESSQLPLVTFPFGVEVVMELVHPLASLWLKVYEVADSHLEYGLAYVGKLSREREPSLGHELLSTEVGRDFVIAVSQHCSNAQALHIIGAFRAEVVASGLPKALQSFADAQHSAKHDFGDVLAGDPPTAEMIVVRMFASVFPSVVQAAMLLDALGPVSSLSRVCKVKRPRVSYSDGKMTCDGHQVLVPPESTVLYTTRGGTYPVERLKIAENCCEVPDYVVLVSFQMQPWWILCLLQWTDYSN